MVTYQQVLADAVELLRAAGVPSPEWDARLLLAHILGVGHLDIPLTAPASRGVEFQRLVSRRAAREPLQYITGQAPFGPLDLIVGPGVFIPRPETESLADWAVRQLKGTEKPVVVDLCAGSGAIAAYIKHFRPDARVYAVELSDAALTFTRTNLTQLGVEVVKGDVRDPHVLNFLDASVQLVVSNPPYVPEDPDPLVPSLEPEVYHDPHMAVFAGVDGMELIPQMLPTVRRLLKPGGVVGIEHDDTTSQAVQDVLITAGFTDVAVLRDLVGVDRFVTARV